MPPILTQTLETEIAAKRLEIAAEEVQTSRTQRVLIVQPLKDKLQSLIEQNESIIAANAILTSNYVPILTPEEIDAERDKKIADEIAIEYPLPAEMALIWKLRIGVLTMESTEIVAYRAWVDATKAKYPKVQ